jgi:tetratricopeptide (TPR) repeat protein
MTRKRRSGGLCLLVLLTAAGASPRLAAAHDGPEHVIEALTVQMKQEGASASLLYRRAVEYRALSKLDRAAEDLQAAVKLSADYLPAQRELSLVRFAQGRNADSLSAIDRAVSLVSGERERAPLYMIRAQVHAATGRPTDALTDCERAFAPGDGEVDWYLTRARIQSSVAQWDAGLAGLRQGVTKTGSAVLEVEYVEMLIDAGRFEEALARIDPQLKSVRWQSAWRLRRGRALLGSGDTAAARAELTAALAEMEPRIRPQTPDLTLVADRGLAFALLGDRERALRDYETVRTATRGETWLTYRLKAALAVDKANAEAASHRKNGGQ